MRPDGRRPDQLRSLEIIPGFQKHAEGSALVKLGDTWVVCSASVESTVPPFLAATLVQNFGSYAIGIYLAVMGLLSLLCVFALKETKDIDLHDTEAAPA